MPKTMSEKDKDDFAGLGPVDEAWANDLKRPTVKGIETARGKGRIEQSVKEESVKPNIQYSEHKAVASFIESEEIKSMERKEKEKDLQRRYEAVQQAENAYIVAKRHFDPKKWGDPAEAITDETKDEILAEAPSFWILNGLKRKTLNTLWGELQNARSQISAEELRRIRSNDFSGNRPSNGVEGVAVDSNKLAKFKKKNLKIEAKNEATHKEIMDQQFPVEDDMPRTKLGSKVDADNLDNGWFINEPHYYTEGSERERVDAIVDILIKEVDPGSTDEQSMLTGDSRGSNFSWDKIYARTGKKLGLNSEDLNVKVFQDVLLEYARRRGYEDYVQRSEKKRKQGFRV
jgi:hypothetical protein